jgi:hypothetical protein
VIQQTTLDQTQCLGEIKFHVLSPWLIEPRSESIG